MKIGIFDPYLDTMGGGEKYMLTAALCLVKNHSVSVFWNPQREEEIKNTAQHRFGFDLSALQFTDNIFISQTPLLERLRKTRNYDVIIYLSDGSIPLVLAKKLIVHFQFPVEWVDTKAIKTRVKMSRVHSIICNSLFTKSFIDKKFGTQSTVLYPPVDVRNEQEYKKEEIILHVGRFTGLDVEGKDFKKQEVMIAAFKKMVEHGVEGWKFILVVSVKTSDREKVDLLKDRTRGFPIQIVENPEHEKLWDLYAKAKIYWHATGFCEDLVSHPEKAEHFGIATVEAMSQGVVPVVINAGGQKEIVENGKNGMLWETLEELKRKTVMLIENDSLWQRLSNNAKDASKRYSKERFCKELYEIIET